MAKSFLRITSLLPILWSLAADVGIGIYILDDLHRPHEHVFMAIGSSNHSLSLYIYQNVEIFNSIYFFATANAASILFLLYDVSVVVFGKSLHYRMFWHMLRDIITGACVSIAILKTPSDVTIGAFVNAAAISVTMTMMYYGMSHTRNVNAQVYLHTVILLMIIQTGVLTTFSFYLTNASVDTNLQKFTRACIVVSQVVGLLCKWLNSATYVQWCRDHFTYVHINVLVDTAFRLLLFWECRAFIEREDRDKNRDYLLLGSITASTLLLFMILIPTNTGVRVAGRYKIL